MTQVVADSPATVPATPKVPESLRSASPAQRLALEMIVEGYRVQDILKKVNGSYPLRKITKTWLHYVAYHGRYKKWHEAIMWLASAYEVEVCAIANRAYRLQELGRLYQDARAAEDIPLALKVLAEAAKETSAVPGGEDDDDLPATVGGYTEVSVTLVRTLERQMVEAAKEPFCPGLPRRVKVIPPDSHPVIDKESNAEANGNAVAQ